MLLTTHRQRNNQPHGNGEGASDISSLDGRLGCSYDHSGVGGALSAPTTHEGYGELKWFSPFPREIVQLP
jgi:hypothetical protein